MQIQSVIIDDEAKNRNLIRAMLKEYAPEIKVIGEAESVSDSIPVLKKTAPQLVFLAIQMNSSQEGFKLFSHFPDKIFEVVFITAHAEHIFKAMNETYAIGYLLKPIDPEELKKVIYKFKKNLLMSEVPSKFIDETWRIESVVYCYIKHGIIKIKLTDNSEKIGEAKTLEHYESQGLFRVNRQYSINLQFVNRILEIGIHGKKTRNAEVLMYNGDMIPVSMYNKMKLLKAIKKNI